MGSRKLLSLFVLFVTLGTVLFGIGPVCSVMLCGIGLLFAIAALVLFVVAFAISKEEGDTLRMTAGIMITDLRRMVYLSLGSAFGAVGLVFTGVIVF